MKFAYKGVTKTREQVSGVIEAQDEFEAKLRLRSMQVRATSLKAKGEGGGSGGTVAAQIKSGSWKDIQLGKPIDLKGLVIFTRQFSSLIDSGVPVVQCLDILIQQEKRKPFKYVLSKVKSDIESGAGLAESLSRHPRAFSEFFIRIVEAGEISGTLDKALRRVGQQLERLGRLKAKVIGAMIYPCITLVVAVIVLIFLLVKVVPEISKLYADNSAKLPELTVQVLKLSQWVQDNLTTIVGGLVTLAVAIPLLYRLDSVRKVWDPLALHLPAFGPLIAKSSIGRFARTLATLVSSGVPLLNSFEICVKIIPNLAVKNAIRSAMASVTEGKSIASGLATSKIFPPMVLHMVSIGEMTGKLDELLAKVADIYDDELDDAIGAMTGLIQPILIVFVGGVIAFLLLAMYLPIFQLADKISGG